MDVNLPFVVLFGPQLGGESDRKNTTFQGKTSKVEAKMLEKWGKKRVGGAYGEIGSI